MLTQPKLRPSTRWQLSAPVGDPLKPAYWLSALIALLLVVAAVPGVFVQGLYHDTAKIVATDRGSDLVTLVVLMPALIFTVLASARGSVRAQLVWIGLLAWTAYNYGVYAFGLRFTPLFLVHVALLSLSIFALAIVVRRLDLARIRSEISARPAIRFLSGFLFLVAAMFAVLWFSDVLPATFANTVPARLRELGATSNPVEIVDLAFVLPLLIVSAILLWRRKPSGFALAGPMFTLTTAVMVGISPGAAIFGGATPEAIYPAIAVFSAVMTTIFLAMLNTRHSVYWR